MLRFIYFIYVICHGFMRFPNSQKYPTRLKLFLLFPQLCPVLVEQSLLGFQLFVLVPEQLFLLPQLLHRI